MAGSEYHVSIRQMSARPIAAVHARIAANRVPAEFARHLDQVYSAARSSGLHLDGQNIFVYRDADDGLLEVEFGVGALVNVPTIGAVRQQTTPAGRAAATTHWGDYSGLRHAHDAVIRWCDEHRHKCVGPRWEVYGHWTERTAELSTDVFYLLGEER